MRLLLDVCVTADNCWDSSRAYGDEDVRFKVDDVRLSSVQCELS
jgi:hypothetical protein